MDCRRTAVMPLRNKPTWTLIKGIGLPRAMSTGLVPNRNENIYTSEWTEPFMVLSA